MPGDDLEIGINDDRDIEAELFDRTSDLPDVLFGCASADCPDRVSID
jgi:hypothetical protein